MISMRDLQRKKKEYMTSQYSTTRRATKRLNRNYDNAATTVKYMEKEGTDLEFTLKKIAKGDSTKYVKQLARWAVSHKEEIDYILKKTNLIKDNSYLKKCNVQVLLGLLLYGHKRIPRGTIETAQLFYYEEDLFDAFVEASKVFCTNTGQRVPTYVRINTLSIPREKCIDAFCKEGWKLLDCPKHYPAFLRLIENLNENEFVRDFHISELLVFHPATSFYEHPGYLKGKFVLQDKGSCLASFLLNPKPGSRVFDMGAATGKTTNHLANIVNNEANVYAADFHPHRYNKLVSFLELTNSTCVETMMSDVKQVCIDNLDYILIDASCSYSGIHCEGLQPRSLLKLRRSYYLNFKLLLYALQNFPTVKRVVYAVNSIFPEEGEKVVDFALSVVKNGYELLDVKELLWNEWFSFGHVETTGSKYPFAGKCLRVDSSKDKCFGYFIAVFQRNFEVPVAPYGFEKWEKPGGMMDEDSSDEETLKPFPKQKFKLVNGFPKKVKTDLRQHIALKKKIAQKKLSLSMIKKCAPLLKLQTSTGTPTSSPTPQTSTKNPVLLPTPSTSKPPGLLPTPQTCTKAPAFLPTPQTCTKAPAFLPTPQTCIKAPAFLPTPQTCIKAPAFLPTPQTSSSPPGLLPTPQTSTKPPGLLPTPQSCTKAPAFLPTPQSCIKAPAFLPTPQTCTKAPAFLPTPQASTRPPGLLPTPQTFTQTPALLRAPQTSNKTLLPTPQTSTRPPGLLPTPQTSYTPNRR